MRQTIFCNHYQAMSDHKSCKAGVNYETFKGLPFEARPCFCRNGKKPPGGCALAVFPTPEELAAEEAEWQKQLKAIADARWAIVEACGGPWKKGTAGSSGKIDCPVCGSKETLCYSRAGYNGHIHAGCRTEGCVSWME